jgi:hypothetical protein
MVAETAADGSGNCLTLLRRTEHQSLIDAIYQKEN